MNEIVLKTVIPKRDSLYGELVYKWNQEDFKTIMCLGEFSFEKGVFKKKLKLPSGKIGTLSAYEKGRILISGCRSKNEMKATINSFFNQKLNSNSNFIIDFAHNLRISSSRCKVELGLEIDIVQLKDYLNEHCLKKNKDGSTSKPKVLIPYEFHGFKPITVYVTKKGIIEIYRAHLVTKINQVIMKVFNDLVYRYVVTNPKNMNQVQKMPLNRKQKDHQNPVNQQSYQQNQSSNDSI